jgi:hypothetical protein
MTVREKLLQFNEELVNRYSSASTAEEADAILEQIALTEMMLLSVPEPLPDVIASDWDYYHSPEIPF